MRFAARDYNAAIAECRDARGWANDEEGKRWAHGVMAQAHVRQGDFKKAQMCALKSLPSASQVKDILRKRMGADDDEAESFDDALLNKPTKDCSAHPDESDSVCKELAAMYKELQREAHERREKETVAATITERNDKRLAFVARGAPRCGPSRSSPGGGAGRNFERD